MQNWGRELERELQAHLFSSVGQSEDHTWALLTCGPPGHLSAKGLTTPTSWADCPVSPFCGLMFTSASVSPSSCPPRSNPKCNTFAMFLLCISLKVWTLFDQIGTPKTLDSQLEIFSSAIICVYPGQKEKEGWWMLCSIPLSNWNSKNVI